MTKYLIIGNGAAGIAAAERIRKLDQKGEVTILSAESYPVYSKCLIADFLAGKTPEKQLQIREEDFYQKKNLRFLPNAKVSKLEPVKHQVVTTDGRTLPYDKLLIATGSNATLPPIPGVEKALRLNTLDDAKRIMAEAKGARRVIVIGGGFTGLEIAINLYKTGKEVTIIERTSRVLQEQLDEKAGRIIQHSLEEEGLRLVLGSTVTRVSTPVLAKLRKWVTGSEVKTIHLADGRTLNADLLIVATGTKPNLSFAQESGLRINKGIIVDGRLQTSLPDVYAAGDVVETVDAVSGTVSLSPIWPNAVIQGEVAGANMAGQPTEFSPLIGMQNACEFREIPTISMGITEPEGPGYEIYLDERPTETVYRKVVIKDDVIVGMLFLGEIRNAGVIGELIRQKTNVAKWKKNILNPNFGYSEVAS